MPNFGPNFKRPSKRVIRLARQERQAEHAPIPNRYLITEAAIELSESDNLDRFCPGCRGAMAFRQLREGRAAKNVFPHGPKQAVPPLTTGTAGNQS